MKLFLKGKRCEGAKCAFEGSNQKTNPPGAKTWHRGKVSTFGKGLREKQKLKRIYGLYELPLRRYFAEAQRRRGNTGENLLILIEQRLDNVVRRLGFAYSGSHARQLVAHGHVYVNGKRTDIPSYQCRVGDEITVTQKDALRNQLKEIVEQNRRIQAPTWLELDVETLTGKVVNTPKVDEVVVPVDVKPVVEFCSK
jgi:small subunit ribosomal protein S4